MGGVSEGSTDAPLIVVAEDDAITREYVGGLLRGHGWRVELLESGSEAVQRAAAGGVSLLLLDVLMPGMNGLDVFHELQRRGNTLPVIVLASHRDVRLARKIVAAGAMVFIEKPFVDQQLASVIFNTIGSDE